FGTAGEELRCAALVVVDMAVAVAQHAAPRWGQGGQAQCVRRRPGGNREHIDLAIKDLAEAASCARSPTVGAIGRRLPGCCRYNGCHDLGCATGGVVAGEGAPGES